MKFVVHGKKGKDQLAAGNTPPLGRLTPCRRGHERVGTNVIWTWREGSNSWSTQCRTCYNARWLEALHRRLEDPTYRADYMRKLAERKKRRYRVRKKIKRILRWRERQINLKRRKDHEDFVRRHQGFPRQVRP